ncbi:MAG: TIGR00725 family protein [Marinilabiliales bacterium]|nr:MAG: TIGR00725 family protein [Marinilabiliales bacterium]
MKYKPRGFVSVIGPSYALVSDPLYVFARELGRALVDNGFAIYSGGKKGIMEAVFRGAKESENYFFGCTIGILPDSDRENSNRYTDISVATGIGYARNSIVANSGEVVIAIGGGSGTLSEIAFAWQYGKKIIAVDAFEGWAKELSGLKLDKRRRDKILKASDIESVIKHLQKLIPEKKN